MKKQIIVSMACLIPMLSYAEKISVLPIDCGPLNRGNYGVVFRVDRFPKGQTYFSRGEAVILCPKLLAGGLISGYESKLPESEHFSESERVVIRAFNITEYDVK